MHLQILLLESPVLIMICNLCSNSRFFFYVLSICGYSVLWHCNFINLKLLRWPWFKKIYFWLCCILVAMRGLPVVVSGATILSCHVRASYYCDFSCHGAQGLGHVGSVVAAHRCQRAGSVVVAHGLRCPKAHGIFLPWPKIDLVSLALQGGSFTPGLGKPWFWFFLGNRMLYFCENPHQECLVYSWFSY